MIILSKFFNFRTARKVKRETKLLEMKIFAKFWTSYCSIWELYTALISTITANILMRMKCPIGKNWSFPNSFVLSPGLQRLVFSQIFGNFLSNLYFCVFNVSKNELQIFWPIIMMMKEKATNDSFWWLKNS